MSSLNNNKNNKANKLDSKLWRSDSELEGKENYTEFLYREFQEGASEISEVTRRRFMTLMGASVAFAGLTGCSLRRPVHHIKPYAHQPEGLVPGEALYYTTTLQLDEDVKGVLVESHEGRPTKIEGNPAHLDSLGALDAISQAAILGLYDPDRVRSPQLGGQVKTWDDFEASYPKMMKEAFSGNGEGFYVLLGTQMSPSVHDMLRRIRKKYPDMRCYRYAPVNLDSQVEGLSLVTGKSILPTYHFDKADRIVSFGSDFLGTEKGTVRSSKLFSKRRDPDSSVSMNRLYVFESHMTLTGGSSDHRYVVKESELESVAWCLVHALFNKGVRFAQYHDTFNMIIKNIATYYHDLVPKPVLDEIAKDLLSHKGRSLLLASPQASPTLHALLYLINSSLDNHDRTLTYQDAPFSDVDYHAMSHVESITELTMHLRQGKVNQLLILGGNPVYDAPEDLNFSDAVLNAKDRMHFTETSNETSVLCDWVLPQSHALESWGDATSLSGVHSLVQPLIQPIYSSRSLLSFLSFLRRDTLSDYDVVRRYWKRKYPVQFESKWASWLHHGIIKNSKPSRTTTVGSLGQFMRRLQKQIVLSKKIKGLELVFVSDPKVYDGRFSNVGWLQEMPHPISKLTWDNAVYMGPKTAKKYDLRTQDVCLIKTEDNSVRSVVFVMPGYAEDQLVFSLGYGRKTVGRVGEGTGFNAYQLRSSASMSLLKEITLEKTSEQYVLSSTEDHGAMMSPEDPLGMGTMADRQHLRRGSLKTYEDHPEFAQEMVEHPPLKSLWKEHVYDSGEQWGMVIDLGKCTGCQACLVACQSENNIPIVGKEEVANGREMHWIRVDRYYEGDREDPKMWQQPVTCLQCENAPCEQVCPVAATVHTEDGLNAMAYNRCIGTRYCGDNCPAKVRRFNFFDYHQRHTKSVKKEREHLFDYLREPDPQHQKQFNPDVTVRMRGVMEKCTYCVQRINKARITSKNQNRDMKDGDVKAACQQTCPADAIIFGNIRERDSEVDRQRKRPRNYAMLSELNIKPRTTYLAAIRNPNHRLVKGKDVVEEVHHG